MNRSRRPPVLPSFLGIEGGGTRTVALLADTTGRPIRRIEAGPGNLRLLSDVRLLALLRSIRAQMPRPAAICIGLAGARTESDLARIRSAAARIWPGIPTLATNDLETALRAGTAGFSPGRSPAVRARVLVLSGTGSCCFGRNTRGKTAKIGGWGHLLGDKGSAYEIGLRALKAVVYYLDRDGRWSSLGHRLLRKLQLNEPDDLIGWIQHARKDDVAALAVEVFEAGRERERERTALDILQGAASSLARDALACAARLSPSDGRVDFVLTGGVLTRQPRFAKRVARLIRKGRPSSRVQVLNREGVRGAVALARDQLAVPKILEPEKPAPQPDRSGLDALRNSPTEQRNPRSSRLHRMALDRAIRLILDEEARVPVALMKERRKIERAIRMIVAAFRRGGRLIYVGAGTSGRLGVLDASECPPTFRTPPDQVQAIIAGGQRALWQAVEGAEDDADAGAKAIAYRGVGSRDVVVGIAASGRTPFVWGALSQARRLQARTILVCFNPNLVVPSKQRPDLIVAPDVGPEVLTGSTRLKAGTATKLILNLFTTLSMVRLGKVVENLMVDLNPTNMKLRDRAVRVVTQLSGANESASKAALEASNWEVKTAWKRLEGKLPAPERLK